jgi:hypothetical protein
MPDYETVLKIVAENPGVDTDEFQAIVSEQEEDPDAAVELLERAVGSKDVVEAAGKYWIVRKGKYSYDSYDHPEPD